MEARLILDYRFCFLNRAERPREEADTITIYPLGFI